MINSLAALTEDGVGETAGGVMAMALATLRQADHAVLAAFWKRYGAATSGDAAAIRIRYVSYISVLPSPNMRFSVTEEIKKKTNSTSVSEVSFITAFSISKMQYSATNCY